MIFLYIGTNTAVYSPIKSHLNRKGSIMIGKLTDDGIEIKRGTKWVKQYCPYINPEKVQNENVYRQCGPKCPIFSDPKKAIPLRTEITSISTCGGKVLEFEEFIDERT
jgi:hypothetical protein